mgnify:FL=1
MKNKLLNILMILIIIVILITVLLIIIKYGKNQVNENRLSGIIDEFETKYNNDEKISEDIMIDDYKVIGIITIPKINLKYPILDRTDNKGMKLSITKFWGSELNEIGNVTLAGHNNRDGTMFGKTKNLEKGDIIQITDMKSRTLDYEVFDYYIIDPNDVSCVESIDGSTKEVTLITCSNGNKKRLVTKAREINDK